jgi:heme exporter protein CcmD
MSHLGYVAASYGLAVAVVAGFAIDAWLRVGRARRRLDAIDPRRRGRGEG